MGMRVSTGAFNANGGSPSVNFLVGLRGELTNESCRGRPCTAALGGNAPGNPLKMARE
jgi:hypothetical protein